MINLRIEVELIGGFDLLIKILAMLDSRCLFVVSFIIIIFTTCDLEPISIQ